MAAASQSRRIDAQQCTGAESRFIICWPANAGYVPVIDVSSFQPGELRGAAGHSSMCDELERACKEAGFFVVTGTPLNPFASSLSPLALERFSIQKLVPPGSFHPHPWTSREDDPHC